MGLPFLCLPCPVHHSPPSCNAIHPGPPTPELLDTSLESPAKPQTTTSTAGLVFGALFPHVPLKCDTSTVTCSSCACEMVEIRGRRAGSKASPAGGPRRLSWRAVSFLRPLSGARDAPGEGQILRSQLHPAFLRTWPSLRPPVLKVDIPAQKPCARNTMRFKRHGRL